MQLWKKWPGRGLSPILLQAFFVVLGVVLAFSANEWREQKNRRQKVLSALESIGNELEENRKLVERALNYHVDLLGKLGRFSKTDSGEIPDIRLFSKGFIAPAQTLNTAWEAARETGTLQYMDYARVQELARIYYFQTTYLDQARSVGKILYEQMLTKGKGEILDNYANLQDVIGTFYYREKQMSELYQTTLESLGRQPKP